MSGVLTPTTDKYDHVPSYGDMEDDDRTTLKKGQDPSSLSAAEQLLLYAMSGNDAAIKDLHKADPALDVNTIDKGGAGAGAAGDGGGGGSGTERYASQATPLHYACMFGHLSTAKLLHSMSANVEARNKLRSTPLHVAAAHGHADIVQFLMDAKADVHAKNVIQNYPLHCAVYAGHVDAARALLQGEEDQAKALMVPNGVQVTPWEYARQSKNMEIRQFIEGIWQEAGYHADDQKQDE